MPCVETKIVINGDSKPIFEIIKNMEAYPSFMHDLVSVEILERGENTTVSHWVSNVDGRKIVWTERDTFYPEEMRITYCQTEGDLKKMEGEWRLVPVELYGGQMTRGSSYRHDFLLLLKGSDSELLTAYVPSINGGYDFSLEKAGVTGRGEQDRKSVV